MRISFLLSSLQLSGGVHVVIEYANRLAERGHQITLVTPGNTVDSMMVREINRIVQIVESRVPRLPEMKYITLLQLAWSLAVATPKSDFVIATHTPTTVASFIATYILRKGSPLWLFQDYQEMFEDRPLESWLMNHAMAWHQKALTISSYCEETLQCKSADRVVIVGEALSNAELFRPVPLQQRPRRTHAVIFFLGDTRPRKGLADFLAAAKLVYQSNPNIKLWIALKDVEHFTCDVPYEFFYLPSRKKLIELYSTCDLFVSASWNEGFGLPPMEAMACGTPVVMTNAHGVMEYAEPEINCLLTPPAHPDLLAIAIQRVLKDQELAQRLSENGPLTTKRFDWESVTDRFEDALRSMG